MDKISIRAKIYLCFLFLILVFSLLYFIQPGWTEFRSVNIYGPFNYGMNPDSPTWARLVMDFPDYFTTEYGKIRIMRPLYVVIARSIYVSVSPIKAVIPEKFVNKVRKIKRGANHPENWVEVDSRNFIIAWGSCVLINIFIYWISAVLIFEGLKNFFSVIPSFLLALFPLLHFDTINFYLMPHSEPFNVFIPALLIFVIGKYWLRGCPGYIGATIFGLSLTAKAIFYPFVNWIYEYIFESDTCKAKLYFLLSSVLIIAPSLLYLVSLYYWNLPLYNHEVVKYRQVIWIFDYCKEGNFFGIVTRLIKGLFIHNYQIFLGFGVPLTAVASILVCNGMFKLNAKQRYLGKHIAVYTLAGVFFWMVVGRHSANNVVGQFPLVIFLTGIITERLEFQKTILISLLILHGLVSMWIPIS